MEQEIINYIKEARKHGLEDPVIKQNLLNAGWEAAAVEDSFVKEKIMQNPAGQNFNPANLIHAQVEQGRPTSTQSVSVPAGITNSPESPKMHKGAKIALILAAVIVLLGGGAFAYYTYAYNSPTKTWDKFLAGGMKSSGQVKTNFSFNYKDTLAAFAEQNPPFKDFNVKLSGNFYADTSDSAKPVSSGSYQVGFSSDSGISINAGTDIIVKDNEIYFHIAGQPLLEKYAKQYFPDQIINWVKFDLDKIKSMATSDGSALPDRQLIDQIKTSLSNANIIEVKKYLGTETINGVNTYHFDNQVNKTALKNLINQSFDALANFETSKNPDMTVSPADTAVIKTLLGSLVDTLDIGNFQTWIGKSDAKLYKVSLSATMPSFLTSVGVKALAQARLKARDAKRIADVQQLNSALELYFNDFNGYPAANSNGEPIGVTPSYIGVVPQAPKPSDGLCSDYYNSYWYSPSGTKHVVNGVALYDSYTYTFCLGEGVGGHFPGIAQMTPSGIKDHLACTGTTEQCAPASIAPSSTPETTAEISFESDFADYEKAQEVTVPTDAVDIFGLLGQQ